MTGRHRDDGDCLSPETVRLVDRVCDRFEAAWRAGHRPRMEDYLTGLGDADRWAALTELVPLDAEYRWAAGETPTAAEYRDRFPELGDDRPAGPLVGGRYELLRLLAGGGMGTVYLAADRRIERPVALKTLAGAAGDPVAADRFRREALALARLRHPNVVAVYDAGEDRSAPYLVTEYVDGTDLARLVRDRGPLPVPEAVEYAVQAARGLHHAHQAGIVHRDVKPSNLMADRDGVVKVLDLGLARLRTAAGAVGDRTAPGAVLGTAAYMAPEQATDPSAADARADVYALGCTLHFLLTGRPAFDAPELVGQLLAHQARRPPSLRRARPDVPAALDRAFRAMVAKDPADRPQTMPDVIGRLEAALARPDRYNRRRAVGAALFIAASAVAVGAGLIVRDGTRANGVGDDPPLARVPFDDPAGYQRRWAERLGLPVERENRAGVKLVLVPPGEFEAGSPEGEKADAVRGGGNPDRVGAEVRRPAAVRAFYLGRTEVTVAQYRRFVGESRYRTHAERVAELGEAVGYGFESGRWVTGPGYMWDFVGKEFRLAPEHPVINVTWEDAVEYCRWLTGPGAGDAVYRLPTEDEWEYACRAGSAGPWCHGEDPDAVPRVAVCGRPVPEPVVGNRRPNGFGLYDMHGNMPEWCLDLAGWPGRRYPGGRVLRGGRFNGPPVEVRSAAREWAHRTSPLGGFRVAAELPVDPAR